VAFALTGLMIVGGFAAVVAAAATVLWPLAFIFFVAEKPVAQVDHLAIVGLTTAGSFYTSVEFSDDQVQWLRSDDGGASWAKAAPPTGDSLRSAASVYTCAGDGVCYLSHYGSRGTPQSTSRIDRLDPDGSWRNEAVFDPSECRPSGLAANPSNSAEVIVDCSDRRIGYRDPGGRWHTVDFVEFALTHR